MKPNSEGLDTFMQRVQVESAEKWREWIKQIPELQFPSHWRVRIIPPFSGALVRFQVTTEAGGWSSVYLDVFDILGSMDEPYWEVYPHDGDVARCLMNETDELIRLIRKSLEERENPSHSRSGGDK